MMSEEQVQSFVDEHYPFTCNQVTYQKSSVNDLYRIHADDDQYYFFRISPNTHYFGPNRLAIEIELLDQLYQLQHETSGEASNLNLPRVVESIEGDLLLDFIIPGLPDTRDCTLMTQIEQVILSTITPHSGLIKPVANAIAELHRLLSSVNLDQQLKLYDKISTSLDCYGRYIDQFDRSHADYLVLGREILDRAISLEPPIQQLHGDIRAKNMMLAEGMQIGFFDFDFTLQGPVSYDVASYLATSKSYDQSLSPDLEEYFISTYQKVSQAPSPSVDEIILMQQLRQLWIFGYWLEFGPKKLKTIEQMIVNNFRVVNSLQQ